VRGPCTPSIWVPSISEVADGPEASVRGRRSRRVGEDGHGFGQSLDDPILLDDADMEVGDECERTRAWGWPRFRRTAPISAIASLQPVNTPRVGRVSADESRHLMPALLPDLDARFAYLEEDHTADAGDEADAP
jgi:hypothetical protein